MTQREYKFRGKALEPFSDGNQWVEGFGVHIVELSIGDKEYWLYTDNGTYEVDPDTVGQYTGLKDKNGKEIYEGDIVKGHRWKKGEKHRHIGIVTYIMNRFEIVGINQYKGMHDELNPTYEIIGNCWDHPHLLEEKDE